MTTRDQVRQRLITPNEYQEICSGTNKYPEEVMNDALILGLCSEAGEVADKRKKYIRDSSPFAEHRQGILKELGDVMWYVSQIAASYGYSLQEVMETNAEKVVDRYKRGTVHGSGDDR